MEQPAGDLTPRRKPRVVHYSPARLLCKKLELPGGITLAAEKRNGRLVLRVELPGDAAGEAGRR